MSCGAMLLKTNGVNADPGLLNTWLRNNAGYINCSTVWTVVDDYPGSTMAWYGAAVYSLSIVKTEIDAGNPVIIHVDLSSACSHFVLIYGYSGSGGSEYDYVVADPASSSFPTYLSDYNICTSDANGSLRLFHNVSVSCVQPVTPVCISPGTGSSPGEVINTLTPTFTWSAVSGATDYDLFIRKNPPSGPLVLQEHCITGGNSFTIASGILENDSIYRWNVQANNNCTFCESGYSAALYFQVSSSVGYNVYDLSANISVFPNPANGYIFANINSPGSNIVSVETLNVLGQTISKNDYALDAGLNKIRLDICDRNKGICFVRFTTTETFCVRKIILQ